MSNRKESEKSPAGGFRLAPYRGKDYNPNKGGARKGKRNAFGLEGFATYGSQNAERRHILLHIPKKFTLPSSEDEVSKWGLPRSGGCVSISREDFDAAFSSMPLGSAMFIYVNISQMPTTDRTLSLLRSQMKLVSRASGMKVAGVLVLPVRGPPRKKQKPAPRHRPGRRRHGYGHARPRRPDAHAKPPKIKKRKPVYPYWGPGQ